MRLDSALKKVVPNISRPKKPLLMKLPDNFQMREHLRPCWFHINHYTAHAVITRDMITLGLNITYNLYKHICFILPLVKSKSSLDPLMIASHLFDRMSPCSTVNVNLPT